MARRRTINQKVVRLARRRGLTIITRRGWGNTSPVYQIRRKTRRHDPVRADTLWAHITVTERQGIKADMRTLHRIGMERFGTGVSYNFAIDMVTGEIGVGMPLDAKGAHTLNDKRVPGYSFDQNAVSHAIAFIGVPGNKPSERAIAAYGKLFKILIDVGALTAQPDFNPHSMVAWKDCPTDAVRAVMPQIRKIATGRSHND